MASIIKSPSFDAKSKLLMANSSIKPVAQMSNRDAEGSAAISADRTSPEDMLQTLKQENDELVANIERLQAKIDELEQSSARQDYAQGYEEGQRAGVVATKAEMQSEIDSVASVLENIHEQGQGYLRQLEQVNVESIYAAVTKIIGKSAESAEFAQQLVREQLKNLGTQNKIIVHLAPLDHQLLFGQGDKAESKLPLENVQFVADDHIQYGGCIIEADGGGLDARLEIQLQQFKDMLLDVYARRQAGDL